MNFYTEDYWQGEQINPFLFQTVRNNFNVEEDVVGGGRKTDWKLHKKGSLNTLHPKSIVQSDLLHSDRLR